MICGFSCIHEYMGTRIKCKTNENGSLSAGSFLLQKFKNLDYVNLWCFSWAYFVNLYHKTTRVGWSLFFYATYQVRTVQFLYFFFCFYKHFLSVFFLLWNLILAFFLRLLFVYFGTIFFSSWHSKIITIWGKDFSF